MKIVFFFTEKSSGSTLAGGYAELSWLQSWSLTGHKKAGFGNPCSDFSSDLGLTLQSCCFANIFSLQLQLIPRDASCSEKCFLLALGWHAKIPAPVSSELIRKSIRWVPGLRMLFQNRIDLPFISTPILLAGEINNASSCLWSTS